MKLSRRFVLILLVILLGSGGVWFWRGRNVPAASVSAAAGLLQEIEVTQGNLRSNISTVGDLDAVQRQDLTFSRMNGTAKLLRLDVKTGNTVPAGQTLASIDAAPYQQALDQANSDLQAAEQQLADLKTPATKLDLAKADQVVADAAQALEQAKYDLALVQAPDLVSLQNALRDAQDSLVLAKLQQTLAEHDALAKNERDLLYSVDWHERRIAELQTLVSTGKANLEQTNGLAQELQTLAQIQADLARIQAGRQLSIQAAVAAVAKAEAAVEDAQTALTTAQAGGDKLALAKAQVAVQDADVTLAVAHDSRDTLATGTDAATLAAAQASVDQKRLAVSDAEATLAATKLVAPFDGTVLQTNVAAGNLVGASTAILTVANMKVLQVVASVDETTIRRVSAGQDVQITFDALAGQVFRGKVVSVPLQGTLQGNVMVYEVPISLAGAENAPLLVGMTANVQIQVGQATNALLVPALALQQVGGKYQVLVPNSDDPQGQPKVVPVEIGLSDGVNTQIVSGLKKGDKVLVQYQTTSSGNNNNNRNGGILNQVNQLIRRGMPGGR